MKNKIFIVLYVIIICIMLVVFFINIEGFAILKKYENKEYSENEAKILTYLTFQKDYVSNYNYANILYKNEKYEKAIAEYKKALKNVTATEKECMVRINYALAICKNIKLNEGNQESINKAINEYQNAVKILTERNCDRHNSDASRLKQEIENEINRLKSLQDSSSQENNEKEQDENEQQSKNQETIETEMKKIKEEAIKEQKEKQEIFKDFNKSYKSTEKNW